MSGLLTAIPQSAVADPDLQIKGGPGLKKIFFQHFEPQFGPKIKGAWPPVDPPLICDGICIYHITVAPSFSTTICGLCSDHMHTIFPAF